jgi:hypothetical protein
LHLWALQGLHLTELIRQFARCTFKLLIFPALQRVRLFELFPRLRLGGPIFSQVKDSHTDL